MTRKSRIISLFTIAGLGLITAFQNCAPYSRFTTDSSKEQDQVSAEQTNNSNADSSSSSSSEPLTSELESWNKIKLVPAAMMMTMTTGSCYLVTINFKTQDTQGNLVETQTPYELEVLPYFATQDTKILGFVDSACLVAGDYFGGVGLQKILFKKGSSVGTFYIKASVNTSKYLTVNVYPKGLPSSNYKSAPSVYVLSQ